MIFRNFEDLNQTWCVVRDEVLSGRLGATGANCNTIMYDPLRHGAGPKTHGRITVYAKEDDYIHVGMRLIQLPAIQHDIRYKTLKDTISGRLSHIRGDGKRISSMSIFWNAGDPNDAENRKPETTPCKPLLRDRYHYDAETDIWKINIVEGNTSERINGKWILRSNYNEN